MPRPAVLLSALVASAATGGWAAKSDTVINMAFVFPYAVNDQVGASSINPNSLVGKVTTVDAASELAVAQVNANPNILPSTTINIVRVNDWDPARPNDYKIIDSGGYASVACINASTKSNVLLAVGDVMDSTTLFTGEIFSHYKVPFCGAVQTSPTLSDKINYPYFWRMQTLTGIGNHMYQLLSSMGVTRAALVMGTDPKSSSDATDIENTLSAQNSNITLLTKIEISPEMEAENDYSYAMSLLTGSSGVDAHYIIVIADANITMGIYQAGLQNGIVGNNYVWIGTTPPFTDASLVSGNDVQGFILAKQDVQPASAPAVSNFVSSWKSANAKNSSRYMMPNNWIPPYSAQGFDCVMNMLIGLDLFLKSNASYTPQLLASGNLSSLLTPKVFSNTGYDGVTFSPIALSTSGDLTLPFMFVSLSPQNFASLATIDQSSAFGVTNQQGTNFTTLAKPYFYGGSSSPPKDKSPPIVYTESVNTLGSSSGITLIILEAIGIIFSLACLVMVLLYRKEKVFKTASPPFSTIFIIGTLCSYVSNSFFINRATATNCHIQLWLPLVGFSMVFGSIIVKNLRVYYLFNNTKGTLLNYMKDPPLLAVASVFVLVEMMLLSIWSATMMPAPNQISISGNQFIYVCQATGANEIRIVATLYAYNIALIIGAGYLSYLTRDIHASYSESVFMSAVVVAFVFVGATILPVLQTLEPSAWNTMIRTIAVWVLTTFTLLSMFGSKAIAMYFSAKNSMRNPTNNSESTNGQGTNSTGASWTPGVRGKKSKGDRTMVATKDEEEETNDDPKKLSKAEYKFHDLGEVIYQPWFYFMWGKWADGYMSLNKLDDRTWIGIEEEETAKAMEISVNTIVSTNGNYVIVSSPAETRPDGRKIRGFDLRLEFEGPQGSEGFLKRFKDFFMGAPVSENGGNVREMEN
ncbi:hypothetical protein HK101_004645 [Irineochytrium annulatum]|nr:hypothetical protein HK101_004645 [Irineochytrium annulatum]